MPPDPPRYAGAEGPSLAPTSPPHFFFPSYPSDVIADHDVYSIVYNNSCCGISDIITSKVKYLVCRQKVVSFSIVLGFKSSLPLVHQSFLEQ